MPTAIIDSLLVNQDKQDIAKTVKKYPVEEFYSGIRTYMNRPEKVEILQHDKQKVSNLIFAVDLAVSLDLLQRTQDEVQLEKILDRELVDRLEELYGNVS